jgi:hypothetical protein
VSLYFFSFLTACCRREGRRLGGLRGGRGRGRRGVVATRIPAGMRRRRRAPPPGWTRLPVLPDAARHCLLGRRALARSRGRRRPPNGRALGESGEEAATEIKEAGARTSSRAGGATGRVAGHPLPRNPSRRTAMRLTSTEEAVPGPFTLRRKGRPRHSQLRASSRQPVRFTRDADGLRPTRRKSSDARIRHARRQTRTAGAS